MKFYVDYFGCRTNQAEIQDCIIQLENSGYKLTRTISEADFGILNTCCVTQRAERDVLKFLNKIYKKTNIKWIITGCMVSKEQAPLQKKYKKYHFLDNTQKDTVVKVAKTFFPSRNNIIYHSAFKSRVFLKIQDGCNFRCAFCIVPFLRGKSISTPYDQVIEKAKYYASLGYKEIVLTGINLSSYGYDIFPRENLLKIIEGINKIKDIEFIRLSSLDPRFLKYDFIKNLSYVDKIAHSFHFSFQSGSNLVLRRMKRGSKTIEYHKIMHDFKQFFPQANYGADIMVGFPGEGEKEFKDTLDFIRTSQLNYLHIFPFSIREGTKAELMEQIPFDLIRKRVNELKELNKNKKIMYREHFRHKTLEGILIEENESHSMMITRNFLSVRVPPLRGYKKKKLKVNIKQILNDKICEGIIVAK